MRSRGRENVNKGGRNRENLHPTMDGDRDGDPHRRTGLSPKVQMRSRRRENMKNEVSTAKGAYTH